MKIEARLFLWVTAFMLVVSGIYAYWTHINTQTAIPKTVEWAGLAGMVLSAGLLGISGSFFWFVSRRIDPRPEDRSDAEIAEGAGELGFFSPGSYWPIALAGAATVTGFAAAFWQVWLLIIGVAFLLLAVGGLLFEYYVGQNEANEATASHSSLKD